MLKIIRFIIYGVIVAGIIAAILYFSTTPQKQTMDVSKGKINNVEAIAQLCAIDIYSEVPVLDTINSKVMFAIQKQKGSISFDLENMEIDADGDTVKITLPPEIVQLYEATEPNSWEVIDTKAIGTMALLRSDKFTIEEENTIKAKIRQNSTQNLYRNGTIARARKEAATNLQTLMEKIYRKPVIVTIP